MRLLAPFVVLALACGTRAPKPAPKPPEAGSAVTPPPSGGEPQLQDHLVASMLCALPDYEYPRDAIVDHAGTGRCIPSDREKVTLVVLHAGRTNTQTMTIKRWWRAGRTLHVEMIGSCVPCHGANFGDRMAPALYAVTVTGVDKLEVTAVPARCTDNCGEIP